MLGIDGCFINGNGDGVGGGLLVVDVDCDGVGGTEGGGL